MEPADPQLNQGPHVELKTGALYLGTLLQSSGASMLWPITTLYMHNQLHESLSVAGVVLMLISLAMMFGSYIGGYMFDHFNPFGVLMGTLTVAVGLMAGISFWHTWPVFALLMVVIGWADGVLYTLMSSYAATITRIDTRKVFNMNYLAMNVGVVVGTLVVGALFQHGVQMVFWAALGMYVGLWLLAWYAFRLPGLKQQNVQERTQVHQRSFHPGKLLYGLLGLTFAIYFGYILWESVVATHMTDLGLSIRDYSSLWTINGVVLIIGQSVLNRYADRIKYRQSVLTGAVLFALSFICLTYARTYPQILGTFMILTLGEMLAAPQIPAWVVSVSDPHAKGHAQGQVMMATSFGRALGPMFAGIVIDAAGYTVLFWLIALIIAGFTLLVAGLARHAR